LSHRIFTALVPVFANNLDAAAFTAMRPSVVTDTVGLETLTEVLAKVSYAICSAPYTYYAALAAYCQAFYVDCYEALGTIIRLPQPRTSCTEQNDIDQGPLCGYNLPSVIQD
jgi:hypothetical protein